MEEDLFFNLYYGNYNAAEECNGNKEIHELASKIAVLTNKLKDTIDPSLLEMFLQLDDAYTLIIDMYSVESYSNGIKFATKFLCQALSNNNSEKK